MEKAMHIHVLVGTQPAGARGDLDIETFSARREADGMAQLRVAQADSDGIALLLEPANLIARRQRQCGERGEGKGTPAAGRTAILGRASLHLHPFTPRPDSR